MRIVHIIPGSGGTFYCENCLRDTALVRALRRLGHDVVMVPLYLPMFIDAPEEIGDVPVFFGGINVYLQQKFALFRRTPRWIDRIFDAPFMLKQAAARESSTKAADLGPMTLSMLKGCEGNQRKELERLVVWLREHAQPDVVHISNALLLGLAGEIKRALGVPIVCSLQDEDTWVDAMSEADAWRCWQAMAEAVRHVDAFIAVSHWYARRMQDRMGLSPDQINVVYLGVEIDDDERPLATPPTPVIGYLSRLCESQGLDRLVDAFLRLKQDPRLRNLRLCATGGITTANRRFLDGLQDKVRRHGAADDVEFLPDFDRAARRKFLTSLTVLSVPVPKGEAFGTFILEALACAVPVVQPNVGAFSEVIQATAGGLVYDPAVEGDYEKTLATLLLDPDRARRLGERGRAAVKERFSIEVMAENLLVVYRRLAGEAEP